MFRWIVTPQRTLALIVAGTLFAYTALSTQGGSPAVGGVQTLSCNGPAVDFDSGIPPDWSVLDNEGGGVVWTNVAGSGEAANFTGGAGDAASVSSDIFNDIHGQTEFDTELRTNSFGIGAYTGAALHYLANYQHVTDPPIERDYLDLDVSMDGVQWATLLSWDEDHGTFRSTPGVEATVNLTPYIGNTNLMIRWHYYDPNSGDNDWYAQIDDVELACWLTVPYGDVDCSGGVSAVDALKILRYGAALPVGQTQPCAALGTPVAPDLVVTTPFGDLDCSGAVNSVDALKTLRWAAGFWLQQHHPCPEIGFDVDFYY
jgi:hypothetical protein